MLQGSFMAPPASKAQHAVFAGIEFGTPAEAPAGTSNDHTVAGLLAFKASITGFDQTVNTSAFQWVASSGQICTGQDSAWQYVLCSDGVVTGLNFSNVHLGGVLAIPVPRQG